MKNIDIYAHPLKLHLNGKYQIKTVIGGSFTLITIFTMLLFAWLRGTDLYFRRKPKNYFERMTMDESNLITFHTKYSPFFFQIFDSNNNVFIDSSILNINLVKKYVINKKIVNSTKIPLKGCQQRHFDEYEKQEKARKIDFDNIIQKQYFCPELTEDINIKGSWIENDLSYLQIAVYPCRNTTNNVICKSQKSIDDLIWNNRLKLSFYYPTLSLSLNDYYNPISYNFNEDYYYLCKTDSYKFYTYGVDNVIIKTDIGVLKTDYSYLYGKSMSLVSNDLRNININDPYFFSIDIFSTFYKDYNSRSYVKIFDIISECGGMFNSITFLFLGLNSIFFDIEVTKLMIKNLFAYKDPCSPLDKEYNTYKLYNKFFNELDRMENSEEKNNKDKKDNDFFDHVNNKEKNKLTKKHRMKEKLDNPKDNKNLNNFNNNSSNNLINSNRYLINKDSNMLEKNVDLEMINFKIKNNEFVEENEKITNRKIYDNLNPIPISPKKKSKTFKSPQQIISPSIKNNLDDHIKSNIEKYISGNANPNLNQIEIKNDDFEKKMIINEKDVNNYKQNANNNNLNESIKINEVEEILPIPDVNDPNFNQEKYHKKYFAKFLKNRVISDTFRLSFWQNMKLLCCKCCYSKNKLISYDSKLNFLINEYSKRAKKYLDYLNIIKNFEETEILIKVLLDEHQINLLELIKKQTIEIPENFEEIQEEEFELLENKTIKCAQDDVLLTSIETLFEKYKYEKRHNKKRPILRINENFIELIRKFR